jgi:predicted nucleic acid-binding protein
MMSSFSKRIFLDTNVYIVGSAQLPSSEKAILEWAGFGQPQPNNVTILISDIVVKQILRVARRVQNKDWGGEIITRIWRELQVEYVDYDQNQINLLLQQGIIPREDVEIYLTAQVGQVDCFISANHKLIRVLAQETGLFEAVTPKEFIDKYLSQ